MINYIKSEMYRTLSSKGIYIFFSFIVGLIIIGNTSMSYFLGYEYTMIENLYSGIKLVNSMDIYCLFYILSFVIIQEYRQNTFKNIISSSLSRGKIYLGKLITVNIAILAMYFIFIVVHIITVLILYKIDKSLSLMNVINFIKHIVYGLPLYIGISSLGCFMVFLLKKDSKVTIVYFISFMFISNIIVYLSYKCKNPKIAEINNYLISPNLSLLGDMNTTSLQVIRASLVGVGFAIVFGVLGYVVFKKQDIK